MPVQLDFFHDFIDILDDWATNTCFIVDDLIIRAES